LVEGATLLPGLAETEGQQQAFQGLALERAFAITVGVASGAILLATYQRTRERILEPALHAITGFVRRRSSSFRREIGCQPRQRGGI
jgi:hypothetical protein